MMHTIPNAILAARADDAQARAGIPADLRYHPVPPVQGAAEPVHRYGARLVPYVCTYGTPKLDRAQCEALLHATIGTLAGSARYGAPSPVLVEAIRTARWACLERLRVLDALDTDTATGGTATRPAAPLAAQPDAQPDAGPGLGGSPVPVHPAPQGPASGGTVTPTPTSAPAPAPPARPRVTIAF